MDNGHVIPGMNEEWTLLGAKLNEWICGFGAFLLMSTAYPKPSRAMPLLIAIMIGTAMGVAYIRRQFPDEERGMRNYCFMLLGIEPPLIPPPAAMQPVWSGAPLTELAADREYTQLGLDQIILKARPDDDLNSIQHGGKTR